MNETKKERIAANVVTFNRKELLDECLNGLLNQTIPLDAIYIIDNASSDGTPEFLLKKGFIDKSLQADKEPLESVKHIPLPFFPSQNIEIHYIRMPENEGGAGGQHEGVKRAYEAGYDFVWLLDDDVEPTPECLEHLMKYKAISGCIHPRNIYPDGTPYEWEGYIDVMTGIRVFLYDISFKNGKEFCFVNFGCFEGMLINREIIEKIGFPDKRFFIIGDDTIYGFLAHLHTNVLYTQIAKMIKKRQKISLASDTYIYYGMRNMFLIVEYLNRFVPHYRVIRYFILVFLTIGLGLYILKNRKTKIKSLCFLIRAISDGIRGKFFKGSI
jgi:GT2 family glycosyltransferase